MLILLAPPAVYAACAVELKVTINVSATDPTVKVVFDDFVLPFAISETATQVPRVAFQITL